MCVVAEREQEVPARNTTVHFESYTPSLSVSMDFARDRQTDRVLCQ